MNNFVVIVGALDLRSPGFWIPSTHPGTDQIQRCRLQGEPIETRCRPWVEISVSVESENRNGRRTIHGEDRRIRVPPWAPIDHSTLNTRSLKSVRRIVCDEHHIVIGQKVRIGRRNATISNKCGVGPLGIVMSVIDSIGCDKIDRWCIAPTIWTFAEKGGTEDTDTIPTVIGRDGKEKRKSHAWEHCCWRGWRDHFWVRVGAGSRDRAGR